MDIDPRYFIKYYTSGFWKNTFGIVLNMRQAEHIHSLESLSCTSDWSIVRVGNIGSSATAITSFARNSGLRFTLNRATLTSCAAISILAKQSSRSNPFCCFNSQLMSSIKFRTRATDESFSPEFILNTSWCCPFLSGKTTLTIFLMKAGKESSPLS